MMMWRVEDSRYHSASPSSSSGEEEEGGSSCYSDSASDSSCVDAENATSSLFGGARTTAAGTGGAVSVRRRMAPSSGNFMIGNRSGNNSDVDEYNNNCHHNDNSNKMNRNDKHHGRHSKSHGNHGLSKLWRSCRRSRRTICRHFPSLLLVLCFAFWLLVQTFNVYDSVQQSTHNLQRSQQQHTHHQHPNAARNTAQFWQRQRRQRDRLEQAKSFVTDAVDGIIDLVGLPVKVFRQVHNDRGEALLPGCVLSDWQLANFPNCNDMHETDLYQVLASNRTNKNGGFVGSGYWRHVWVVRQERVVLKMMKSEHKVETRNFERHRRDALAMERLTSAPNIVDIYAYCGNSVLTEYVGRDLHRVLYHHIGDNDEDEASLSSRKPPPLQYQRTDRETLELALGITRGVAALHQVPGGPIVHADISDKQFLIDERGNVKLNDFNRCRFMGHHEQTGEKCTFRIPSAPGRHRSPEEYEDKELTEQLDTYSTANVLYGLLTGTEPWGESPSSQVKRAVKHGLKPPIEERFRIPGTINALLANLVEQAYEHDPLVRITAPAMVAELEEALAALPSEIPN